MELYAMYLRKSRADDVNEPIEVTLQKHRRILDEFAQQNNYHIRSEDIYEEIVSGTSIYARPQMLRMLEVVETGKYAGVLCVDIQRLGRGSLRDQGVILDAFKYSDTKIITPTKVYDLNDDVDETYTEFESFMARQEYKLIRKRLRRGILASLDNGAYIANAPYGYESARVGKVPSLRINEDEAKFVRMMFDLYVNQGMGCQSIADTVNRLGAKPHRSDAFGRSSVAKIIRNPVYIGKIVWNQKTHVRPGSRGNTKHMTIYNPKDQWTIKDGVHPPIVSEDLFKAAQTIYEGRYHPPSNNGTRKNPISSLVICGNCGHPMQRIAIQAAGGPLLGCAKRGCIVSSKLDYVVDAVIHAIWVELDRLAAIAESDLGEREENYIAMAKSIDTEIIKARQQLSRLHDLLEQGVYDIDTFTDRRKQLISRIEELETTKEGMPLPQKLDIDAMRERITNVMDVYKDADPNTQNQLLKTIVEKIVYHKERGAKPAEFTLEVFLYPIYF